MIDMVDLEKCPECGALGSIDDDQRAGRVSIECSECGHHYFKEVTTVV